MGPIDKLSARWFVRPGSVVYDIGTLHGAHAAHYLKRGAAAVYGFEPLARNRDRIPEALAGDPRFHLLPYALSDRSGPQDFHVPAHNDGAGSLSRSFLEHIRRGRDRQGEERHSVEARTLDELGLPPADFWKIDVEGAELAMLRGAERTLAESPPKVVEVEIFFHDPRIYADTVELLRQRFAHVWALGVTAEPRVIHYPVNARTTMLPDFHRDLARAGTPHYFASCRAFPDWLQG